MFMADYVLWVGSFFSSAFSRDIVGVLLSLHLDSRVRIEIATKESRIAGSASESEASSAGYRASPFRETDANAICRAS